MICANRLEYQFLGAQYQNRGIYSLFKRPPGHPQKPRERSPYVSTGKRRGDRNGSTSTRRVRQCHPVPRVGDYRGRYTTRARDKRSNRFGLFNRTKQIRRRVAQKGMNGDLLRTHRNEHDKGGGPRGRDGTGRPLEKVGL